VRNPSGGRGRTGATLPTTRLGSGAASGVRSACKCSPRRRFSWAVAQRRENALERVDLHASAHHGVGRMHSRGWICMQVLTTASGECTREGGSACKGSPRRRENARERVDLHASAHHGVGRMHSRGWICMQVLTTASGECTREGGRAVAASGAKGGEWEAFGRNEAGHREAAANSCGGRHGGGQSRQANRTHQHASAHHSADASGWVVGGMGNSDLAVR